MKTFILILQVLGSLSLLAVVIVALGATIKFFRWYRKDIKEYVAREQEEDRIERECKELTIEDFIN